MRGVVPVGLVEAREEQRPLELGVHHYLLLHTRAVHIVAHVRSLEYHYIIVTSS